MIIKAVSDQYSTKGCYIEIWGISTSLANADFDELNSHPTGFANATKIFFFVIKIGSFLNDFKRQRGRKTPTLQRNYRKLRTFGCK
jgi:hypothetical protein